MRRPVVIVSAVLLVALVVALWWLVSSLDAFVARAIERAGSQALGVPVRVGSVSIDLREGRGTVRDLRVANPEGFSSEPAVQVDEIVLGLRPAAVREDPIVVDEITVTGPRVLFEADARGRANLDVLRRNAAQAPDQPSEAAPEEEAPSRRLVLERLAMEEGRIVADLEALDADTRELALPPLRMRNVGGRSGAPPAAIARRVAERLLAHVAAAVAAERLGVWLEQRIDEGLGEAGEAAKGALRSLLGREAEPAPE